MEEFQRLTNQSFDQIEQTTLTFNPDEQAEKLSDDLDQRLQALLITYQSLINSRRFLKNGRQL